jgi:hypothetical protein
LQHSSTKSMDRRSMAQVSLERYSGIVIEFSPELSPRNCSGFRGSLKQLGKPSLLALLRSIWVNSCSAQTATEIAEAARRMAGLASQYRRRRPTQSGRDPD